jgi:putative ABC transport system permease protein
MNLQLLKAGFRNLRQNKVYALIHLASLSLGLCTALCVFLYISDELAYDRFHQQGDRIYRISETTHFNATEHRYPTTPAVLADFIRLHVTDVQATARVFQREGAIQVVSPHTTNTITRFREANVLFAEPGLFSILSFQFLKGTANTALLKPNDVVLSHRVAEKYFGSAGQAMGQEILFEGNLPLTISAVIEDYPYQSHLTPEVILPFEHYYATEGNEVQRFLRTDWLYNPLYTYVLLKPGVDPAQAGKAINTLPAKYGDERAATGVTFSLQPLHDIHLYSDFTFSEQPNAIRYVYILAAIGLLVLIIACVNFINLSTVHALKRAREIGVRKVLGAGRASLAWQFMGETLVMTCIAFLIAVVMLYLALPGLNILSHKHFTTTDLLQGKMLSGMLGILVTTFLLSGAYPSLFITRFNPLTVLMGFAAHRGSQGYQLRRVLIVGQFAVAITMVVLAFVFHQQMDFIHQKPLGYQKDHMLTIPLFSEDPNSFLGGGVDIALRGRMNTLEDEVLSQRGAEAVTVSSALPGQGAVNALVQTDSIQEHDNVFVAATSVDYDFLDAYKIPLAAGRNFSKATGTDHLQAFVINESASKMLGWLQPGNAIGQHLNLLGKEGYVIGVVRDFHFQGLQQPLRPLILEVAASKFTVFSLRLPHNRPLQQSIAIIQQAWNKVFPEKVFDHRFLDEHLQQAYDRERRLTRLMQYFSFLTVLIAALGLFGLAAYVNHRRAKEVSIRKLLGATPAQVFALLAGEFLKLVLLALAIGWPLSYWAGMAWLSDFAYKTPMHMAPFVAGAGVALLSVLIAVSYETIRTALINPANQLRKD